MANAKLTKKDYFNQLLKIETVASNKALKAFIDHEIELLSRKNSSKKATATQIANEGIKEQILEFLTSNGKATVSAICKGIGVDSNQKISALVRQLKEAELVVRSVEKGVAYFEKVAE